jgi:hypothetical protein
VKRLELAFVFGKPFNDTYLATYIEESRFCTGPTQWVSSRRKNPILPGRFPSLVTTTMHIAQPGDAAPWDFRMLGAELLRQPLGCLPYDFKLANDSVLPMRGRNEDIMTHGDIGLDFFDGV